MFFYFFSSEREKIPGERKKFSGERFLKRPEEFKKRPERFFFSGERFFIGYHMKKFPIGVFFSTFATQENH